MPALGGSGRADHVIAPLNDDRWQMANGKWQMANGKWQMAYAIDVFDQLVITEKTAVQKNVLPAVLHPSPLRPRQIDRYLVGVARGAGNCPHSVLRHVQKPALAVHPN